MITLAARDAGSGGGFSRMTSGGGVFGGLGRSESRKISMHESEQTVHLRLITKGGNGACC